MNVETIYMAVYAEYEGAAADCTTPAERRNLMTMLIDGAVITELGRNASNEDIQALTLALTAKAREMGLAA